jgi:FkbM family methyltransferase
MGKEYSFKFPFEKCWGANVVIYGAGQVGREYIEQIQLRRGIGCNLLYIADKDYESIRRIEGVEVCPPERLRNVSEYDFVLIASWWFADEMYAALNRLRVPSAKVVTAFPLGSKPFASHGEDVAVYIIFKLLGKDKFTYIDIGANDPYNGSNTAYLYMRGCRGICVEANPDLIGNLKEERPEDIVLNAGVAPEAGVLPYYMFRTHTFNTFSPKLAERAEQRSPLLEVRNIPVVPLTEIIDQHNDGMFPDFLQIDIEGFDHDVLESCDFSASSPMVICTEVDGVDMRRTSEMLDAKGFVPVHRSLRDVIFLRKDIKDEYPRMATLEERRHGQYL